MELMDSLYIEVCVGQIKDPCLLRQKQKRSYSEPNGTESIYALHFINDHNFFEEKFKIFHFGKKCTNKYLIRINIRG